MAAVIVALLTVSLIASILVLAAVVAAGRADKADKRQTEIRSASSQTAERFSIEERE